MAHYGTLAEANAYHTERGNAAWTGTDGVKTAALTRASTWIDATYGARFPGNRTEGRNQELQWPRAGAQDIECWPIEINEIPIEIKRATFEAALRELVTPNSLSPDYVAAERVKRERVGPLETEYVDTGVGVADVRPIVSIVDDILSHLLPGERGPSLFGSVDRA